MQVAELTCTSPPRAKSQPLPPSAPLEQLAGPGPHFSSLRTRRCSQLTQALPESGLLSLSTSFILFSPFFLPLATLRVWTLIVLAFSPPHWTSPLSPDVLSRCCRLHHFSHPAFLRPCRLSSATITPPASNLTAHAPPTAPPTTTPVEDPGPSTALAFLLP